MRFEKAESFDVRLRIFRLTLTNFVNFKTIIIR